MKQMERLFILVLTTILLITPVGCSDKEPLVDLEQDTFLGVGKWKIKKKGVSGSSKENSCDVTDLILNSTFTFKIYTSDNGVLTGTYEVLSPERIRLSDNQGQQIGSLINISVEEDNISFDIELTGVCQSSLEGEKDISYEENKTYIADATFENYLIEEGLDDVLDNYVLTSNINDVSYIDLEKRGIVSLVGIEDFEDLQNLSAPSNDVSGILDLSNNKKLQNLNLSLNPIEELYLKDNNFFLGLWIYGTKTLKKLEISNSPNLQKLVIHNNQIKSLDFLSKSTEINELRIWDSQLDELDLSLLSKLEYLIAGEVFDTLSSTNGKLKLPSNSSLKVLSLWNNRLEEIDLSTSNKLERMNLEGNKLVNIDFSFTSELEYVSLENNQLQNLDLSPITNLFWLRAQNNNLSCINVSESQLSSIPPSCRDLNIPDSDQDDIETCYNTWAWQDEYIFPLDYEISSTWVVDDGVIFSTNCN